MPGGDFVTHYRFYRNHYWGYVAEREVLLMAKLGDICTKESSSIAQNELVNCNGIYPIYGASGLIKNVDFYKQENPYIAVVKDGAGVGRVMSPVYDGKVMPVSFEDEYGTIDVFMLPFLKPANVRRYYPDEEISSYTDTIRVAINNMKIDTANRNVLITHQFVTGALRSESEDISVGGSDNVDASVFNDFDYVALGHIHRPQNIGSETVRYSGTPLKYSFSEASHQKSVTVIELAEKSNVSVQTVALKPQHDLREIKGTYMELTAKSNYEDTNIDDYLHITLTDEDDIPNAIGNLRVIYPNLMKLDYDNKRTRSNMQIDGTEEVESKTPLELFSEFYEKQNNQLMSEDQLRFSQRLIEKIWEDEA